MLAIAALVVVGLGCAVTVMCENTRKMVAGIKEGCRCCGCCCRDRRCFATPQIRGGRTGPGRSADEVAQSAIEDVKQESVTTEKAEELVRAEVPATEVSRSVPPARKSVGASRDRQSESRSVSRKRKPAEKPQEEKFGADEWKSLEGANETRDYSCLADMLPKGWDPEPAVDRLTETSLRRGYVRKVLEGSLGQRMKVDRGQDEHGTQVYKSCWLKSDGEAEDKFMFRVNPPEPGEEETCSWVFCSCWSFC